MDEMKRHLLVLVVSIFVISAAHAENTLDVYWVDVEGGAATLIVTPAGQSILIDTGNPGTRDAGRIHEVATKLANLKKIDFLNRDGVLSSQTDTGNLRLAKSHLVHLQGNLVET